MWSINVFRWLLEAVDFVVVVFVIVVVVVALLVVTYHIVCSCGQQMLFGGS